MQETSVKKILIIRLSALGDTIHTLPMANAIRKQFPNIQLDWVVEDKAAKFIVNNPLINNVYVLKRSNQRNKEFFSIIKDIRKQKYDIVIDTQQLLKSAVIMGLSGAKRKISLDGGREFSWIFANEIIKTGKKLFDINYHVVKRNLDIAKYLGCTNLEPEFIIPDFSNNYSAEIKNIINNLSKNQKTIAISPATTWENKHWTIQGWVDLINEFKDKYNIIITATEKERNITGAILKNIDSGRITDLTGKTDLSDLVYIFKNADLVISPDSGSAHVAWAVNHPKIITLFFATSSARTAPYGDKYTSISSKTLCSPCMKKHCRQKNNYNNCINEINSQEVINIVKNVLQ